MKWKDVKSGLANPTDESARAIRTGLSKQLIVVTDPMEHVRGVDAFHGGPATLSRLLDRSQPYGNETRRVLIARGFTKSLSEVLFHSSGVGQIAAHVHGALSLERDGMIRGHADYSSSLIDSAVTAAKGSLTAATRIASSATSLSATLIDPDSAYHSRRAKSFESYLRYADPDGFSSRIALKEIARRKLVLDEGHGEASIVESFRQMAAVTLAMDEFEEWESSEDNQDVGFVRDDSDNRVLSLQVADVAAGWARSVLSDGYEALTSVFRVVLYNGRELARDEARQLDTDIREHRNRHFNSH
jgi:hypothetical protein